MPVIRYIKKSKRKIAFEKYNSLSICLGWNNLCIFLPSHHFHSYPVFGYKVTFQDRANFLNKSGGMSVCTEIAQLYNKD